MDHTGRNTNTNTNENTNTMNTCKHAPHWQVCSLGESRHSQAAHEKFYLQVRNANNLYWGNIWRRVRNIDICVCFLQERTERRLQNQHENHARALLWPSYFAKSCSSASSKTLEINNAFIRNKRNQIILQTWKLVLYL